MHLGIVVAIGRLAGSHTVLEFTACVRTIRHHVKILINFIARQMKAKRQVALVVGIVIIGIDLTTDGTRAGNRGIALAEAVVYQRAALVPCDRSRSNERIVVVAHYRDRNILCM